MRIDILEQSLEKKKSKLQHAFDARFNHQALTNGQPMNDKRNGAAWFGKADKLDDAIRRARAEVEKTEKAIAREKSKIANVEYERDFLPQFILDAVESGELIQWRKYPNRFFVKGVDKGRIIWDNDKKVLMHAYLKEVSKEQYPIFRDAFNSLNKKLKDGEK